MTNIQNEFSEARVIRVHQDPPYPVLTFSNFRPVPKLRIPTLRPACTALYTDVYNGWKQMDDSVWFCLMLFNIDILASVAAHIDIRISICIALICEQTWYWCRFQRMERDIDTEYPLLRSEGYTRYQVTNSIIEPKMGWFHIKKKVRWKYRKKFFHIMLCFREFIKKLIYFKIFLYRSFLN